VAAAHLLYEFYSALALLAAAREELVRVLLHVLAAFGELGIVVAAQPSLVGEVEAGVAELRALLGRQGHDGRAQRVGVQHDAEGEKSQERRGQEVAAQGALALAVIPHTTDEADEDRDGEISFEEFKNVMLQMKGK